MVRVAEVEVAAGELDAVYAALETGSRGFEEGVVEVGGEDEFFRVEAIDKAADGFGNQDIGCAWDGDYAVRHG